MALPTQQAFTEAYKKAPQYVKNFIDGDELNTAFDDIRKTHKLHLNDAGVFADILNAVILELMPLGEFEAALAQHLPSVTQDTRTQVTRAANEKVFALLRKRAAEPAAVKTTALPQTSQESAQSPVTAPERPVFVQKLATPTSETPKSVTVAMPSLSVETKPIENPRYSAGVDPYREPIE